MKIKYNIPILNNLKNGIRNIKSKVNRNKKTNIKTNMKYYTLLILMLLLGVATFSTNIKQYNDINSENYIKYEVNDSVQTENNKVEINYFDTAISSISTNVSNIIEQEEIVIKNNNTDEYIYPITGEIYKEYAMDSLVYSNTLEMWRVHPGIDIAAELYSDVVSIADGKVIDAYKDDFYGYTVKIEHNDGYVSIYSNLDGIDDIYYGKSIKKGEVIGNVGISANGEIADKIHLHFELLKNNEWINPLVVLE